MVASSHDMGSRRRKAARIGLCLAFLGNCLYAPLHLAEEAHLGSRHSAERPDCTSVLSIPEDADPNHDPHSTDDHAIKAAPSSAPAYARAAALRLSTETVRCEPTIVEAGEPTARGPPFDPPRPSIDSPQRSPGAPRAPPSV